MLVISVSLCIADAGLSSYIQKELLMSVFYIRFFPTLFFFATTSLTEYKLQRDFSYIIPWCPTAHPEFLVISLKGNSIYFVELTQRCWYT